MNSALKIFFYGEDIYKKLRSYLISSKDNTKILLDCGISPNIIRTKITRNEIFPDKLLNEIDAIFISHAHLDHWGNLPRLIVKGYNNAIFMTESTKDILEIAIKLYFKETNPEDHALYREAFHKLKNLIKTYDYGVPIDVKDLKIYFLPANHILGSAQMLIEDKITEKQILYTGDFNPRGSALFNNLSINSLSNIYNLEIKPKAVISESSKVDFTENDFINEEKLYIETVKDIFNNNGDVLIPISAIGDAQDFLARNVDYILKDDLPVPLDIFTIGSLLLVNKIYIKYRDKFRNPEIVDFFDKHLILKIFEDTLTNDFDGDWNLFFNNKINFGNKFFIATGGNLVGTAFRVYNYLKKASKNMIIIPKRFEVENCNAKILKLRMFSLHGNYNSLLDYIKEIEDIGRSHYFLTHGYYENLKYFNDTLNKINIISYIPKKGEFYEV